MSNTTLLREQHLAKLCQIMDWVVPPDATPGASIVVEELFALLEDLGPFTIQLYTAYLPTLQIEDLGDLQHPLGPMLVEHVRDMYYASPSSGAWADVGFVVTG